MEVATNVREVIHFLCQGNPLSCAWPCSTWGVTYALAEIGSGRGRANRDAKVTNLSGFEVVNPAVDENRLDGWRRRGRVGRLASG